MPSQESPLFTPTHLDPQGSATIHFLNLVNATHGLNLQSYSDLYEWSITHIDAFWALVWDFTSVIGDKGAHVVDNHALPPANPAWFIDARVNWAENMLQCRSQTKMALIEASCVIFVLM